MGDGVIRSNGQRVLQKRGRRAGEYTDDQRALFFGTLAQTCHVARSAQAAGIDISSAYHKRRSDPVFAEEWRLALTMGYERLEEELLCLAIEGLAGAGERVAAAADAVEAKRPGAGMPRKVDGSADVQLALALLNRHRATADGRGKAVKAARRATPEETDALLRKQLDSLARRLRASDAA